MGTTEEKTYSLQDIATELGISKQAVCKKINKYKEYYQPYIVWVKNSKHLTEEGYKKYKEDGHKHSKKKITQVEVEIQEYKEKYIKLLEEHKKLQEELSRQKDTNIKLAMQVGATKNLAEASTPDRADNDKPKGIISRIIGAIKNDKRR